MFASLTYSSVNVFFLLLRNNFHNNLFKEMFPSLISNFLLIIEDSVKVLIIIFFQSLSNQVKRIETIGCELRLLQTHRQWAKNFRLRTFLIPPPIPIVNFVQEKFMTDIGDLTKWKKLGLYVTEDIARKLGSSLYWRFWAAIVKRHK